MPSVGKGRSWQCAIHPMQAHGADLDDAATEPPSSTAQRQEGSGPAAAAGAAEVLPQRAQRQRGGRTRAPAPPAEAETLRCTGPAWGEEGEEEEGFWDAE